LTSIGSLQGFTAESAHNHSQNLFLDNL